jgi:hypothetical protein
MTPADQYRVKAAEFNAKAREETNSTLRAECERLALGYRHLAELAERNSQTDIVYETPSKRGDASSEI